jgi:lipopolysaccharide/colanic/teichoic acid biosynthesis glycosyltransferase
VFRVFSLVTPARIFTLFISEIILLSACYVGAVYADPDIGDPAVFFQFDDGYLRVGIVIGFITLGLFFRDLYSHVRVRSRVDLFQNLCVIFGVAFIGQGLVSYLHREWLVPRRIMLAGSVLAFAVLFGWRLLFNLAARNVTAITRVLFLGWSPTVVKLATYFNLHSEMGVAVVGYLESGCTERDSSAMPCLGSVRDLEEVIDGHNANTIVIAKRHDIQPSWVGEFLTLRFGGVRIEEAGDVYAQTFVRKCIAEMWPSHLVFAGGLEPNPANLSFQSAYSPVLAFIAILITSPLLLAAAILIRLTTRGPVTVTEPRIGLNGRLFGMYRFRCHGAEGNLTAAGKILERLGLDSLPALFNVLRGDVSVVGPRAEHPTYSRRLSAAIPFYGQRQRVKPGLTGWARVHGSDHRNDMLHELEYDLYYVENMSPMLDSLILLLALKNLAIR